MEEAEAMSTQAAEASHFVVARACARACARAFVIPHRPAPLRPLRPHSLLLPVGCARAPQAIDASQFFLARARAAEAGRLAISHCIVCYESMKSKL
jgi:hypothetical protein